MLTKGIKDFIRAELKAMGDEIDHHLNNPYLPSKTKAIEMALTKRGVK